MELKTKHHIEITKGDTVYTFIIPDSARLGEAYDASFEAMQYVRHLLNEDSQKAENEKAAEQQDADNGDKEE